MTEIKESLRPDAGRGVFATRDFEIGEYVCFYDGVKRPMESAEDHEYAAPDGNNNILIGKQNVDGKLEGVAQLINDYCALIIDDEDSDDYGIWKINGLKVNAKIQLYNLIASEKANVVNNNGNLYAIKPIKAGDELYYKYGENYWIFRSYLHAKSPLLKLYFIIRSKMLLIEKDYFIYRGALTLPVLIFRSLGLNKDDEIFKYLHISELNNKDKLIYLYGLIDGQIDID